MRLSSNSLFHFTPKIEYLIDILENSFTPRYCLESIDHLYPDNKKNLAIPMNCFCDIPLSAISNHVIKYGEYGLGLTKSWGISQGLSPVMYINKDSVSNKLLNRSISNAIKHDKFIHKIVDKIPDISIPEEFKFHVMYPLNLSFLSKPYYGSMRRGDEIIEDIVFYDEKEWRYIPVEFLLQKDSTTVFGEKIFNSRKKEMNDIVKNYVLNYLASDITQIIISKESEREQIIGSINRITSKRFTKKDKLILTSKIISTENIINDY